MSLEVLNRIKQAEQEAAEIREKAAEDGREVIKAAEETLSAEAQKAVVETRQSVQAFLEQEKQKTQDEIDSIRAQRAEQREAVRAEALNRLPQACDLIIDRVLKGS